MQQTTSVSSTEWLSTATELADRLAAAASHDAMWPTPTPPGIQLSAEHSISLWSGTAGVALFLSDVFRATGSQSIKAIATAAADTCVARADEDADPKAGFLTGYGGVVYLLLRMADSTGDAEFVHAALRLALRLWREPALPGHSDYLSGTSGQLLVLLELEKRLPDPEIIWPHLDRMLHTLLTRVRPSKVGLFWDVLPKYPRPLCGFAHGPSGIAFVLLHILQRSPTDPLLRKLIQSACEYEDSLFNTDAGNWPDLRVQGQQHFMNAWCHGAAGIGATRLLASRFDIPGAHKFSDHAITRCVADTRKAEGVWATYTLCHGLGGVASHLLDAHLLNGDSGLLKAAEVIGAAAVDQVHEIGGAIPGYNPPNSEDYSLFVGTAGVGHLLLRLANPRTRSVLAPWPDREESAERWKPSSELVWRALADRMYPRTRKTHPYTQATPLSTAADLDLETMVALPLLEGDGSFTPQTVAFSLDRGSWSMEASIADFTVPISLWKGGKHPLQSVAVEDLLQHRVVRVPCSKIVWIPPTPDADRHWSNPMDIPPDGTPVMLIYAGFKTYEFSVPRSIGTLLEAAGSPKMLSELLTISGVLSCADGPELLRNVLDSGWLRLDDASPAPLGHQHAPS